MEPRVTYYMVECDYLHETMKKRAAFDEFYWKLATVSSVQRRSPY